MSSLSSTLNIKNAMGGNMMTVIKTHSGLGCCEALPSHTLLFNRISEKELWLLVS